MSWSEYFISMTPSNIALYSAVNDPLESQGNPTTIIPGRTQISSEQILDMGKLLEGYYLQDCRGRKE